MLKSLKKTTALCLALLMVMVGVLGQSITSYAGGDEEWGVTGSVTEATISGEIDEDGYYPASFQYFIQSLYVNVTYEDGTTGQVRWWSDMHEWQGEYGYQAHNDYGEIFYLRLYDAEGNIAEISNDHVELGDFTMTICKGTDEPFFTSPIKIIEAPEGEASANKVSFSNSDVDRFEEMWYPINPKTGKEYVYSAENWTSGNTSYFASIWIKNEDGSVSRLERGLDSYGSGNTAFCYTSDGTNELYLAVGEQNDQNKMSGDITWALKKQMTSVELNAGTSYLGFNGDLRTIPVTVTYADGSTETIDKWYDDSCLHNVNGNDTYLYYDCYYAATKNLDYLYMGVCNNGTWEDASNTYEWKSGKNTWKVYLKEDPTVCDTANITIASPSTTKLTLKEGAFTEFSVNAATQKYYTFTTTESCKIEVVNCGSKDLSSYVYYKNTENGMWRQKQSSLLDGGDSRKIDLEAETEYLIAIEADEETSGTIGLYVKGTTKSAEVRVTEVDASDYTSWNKLPIKVNFVGTDGSTAVGSQVLANWDRNYSAKGTASAETKYWEYVYYALYSGDKLVEVPIVTEDMVEWLGEYEGTEEFEYILMELGISNLYVEPGTYTLKVYLGSISEDNVIGTSSLKVIDGSVCTSHKWDDGVVTKAATVSANGKKTYTCTSCGEKKTETIYKASDVSLKYTSYTYDGTAKKPSVIVKNSKGKTIPSSQYTVKYETGRKNVGKYKVTITFKDGYSGSEKLYFKINPKATSISSLKAGGRSITVKWKKVDKQVSGYQIKYAMNSSFKDSKTITIEKASTVSKTIKSLTAGKKYYVKVRVYKTVDDTKYYSSWSKTKTVTPKPVATSISSLTAGGRSFTVKWKKVTSQVTGYQIKYSTSSSFKESATDTATVTKSGTVSKTIKNLTAGKKYYVKVRTYRTVNGTKYYSDWSETKVVTPKPVATSITKVTPGSKKITLKWKEITSQATGYQIEYSTSSSFKNSDKVKVTDSDTTSKTIKGLKSGKTYYVRIRTYRVVNGKTYYSAWSIKKLVKVK